MDHEVRVCVPNGIQHLQEQLEPAPHRQTFAIAVSGDWRSFYVFEREIRDAFRRDTRVVQARDVRMLEARENVPFPGHALGQRADPADMRAFQRNRAFHQAVGALGQPHAAHAALANGTNEAIRTHVQTAVLWLNRVGIARRELRWRIERAGAHIVRFQQ